MSKRGTSQMSLFDLMPQPVKEFCSPRIALLPSRLTVLSFGGGQDSTTLLYLLALNSVFRAKWAPHDLLVIMSDTGDEHPATYKHVEFIAGFCKEHGIDFVFLTSNMGYHSEGWLTLRTQYRAKNTIGSRAFAKSCTDQLKLTPIYKYLEGYLVGKYDLDSKIGGKKGFQEFAERYGKITMMIGIAAGEESRCALSPEEEQARFDRNLATVSHMLKSGLTLPDKARAGRKMVKEFASKIKVIAPATEYIKEAKKITSRLFPMSPVWRRSSIQTVYPLIDMNLDRQGCQDYMKSTGLPVPWPSNCLLCPFASDIEMIWLNRFHKEDWDEWVKLEQAKIDKHLHLGSQNHGVCGSKLLPQVLEEALAKYGHMTEDQLHEYKFSHGHCVMSAY